MKTLSESILTQDIESSDNAVLIGAIRELVKNCSIDGNTITIRHANAFLEHPDLFKLTKDFEEVRLPMTDEWMKPVMIGGQTLAHKFAGLNILSIDTQYIKDLELRSMYTGSRIYIHYDKSIEMDNVLLSANYVHFLSPYIRNLDLSGVELPTAKSFVLELNGRGQHNFYWNQYIIPKLPYDPDQDGPKGTTRYSELAYDVSDFQILKHLKLKTKPPIISINEWGSHIWLVREMSYALNRSSTIELSKFMSYYTSEAINSQKIYKSIPKTKDGYYVFAFPYKQNKMR